ncbi:hypothetical protein QLL95_gp0161 [Cotonvirus japonicus]|uniref:Uncharacterized protein n=1 Tax=Cotonvirus japonicus TaxID=2811091 RepID=A0ABM7NR68_9VIRU|nr:hypothetical protein QLL95_gp0161 [Cotonvirus japonicus]BCS82650.1 hypothetical protein [Cotonvirus japonicus]
MDFKKIMRDVQKKQLLEFKYLIKDEMDKKYYLSVFLGCFLGNGYLPVTQEQYNTVKDVDTGSFYKYCHSVIDKVSLCGEEIDFFHKMVDIDGTENYIEQCLATYKTIKNLDKCQLGNNILNFLNSSKHIKII